MSEQTTAKGIISPAVKRKLIEKGPAAKSAGFCIYLGPTIPNKIQTGTIFRGTKTRVLSGLKSVVDEYPLVASLIVTGDTLPEDRIKVKTPGNLLYVNYHKLASGKK